MAENHSLQSHGGQGIPTGDQLKQLATSMGSDLRPSQIGPDTIDLRLDDRYRRLRRWKLGFFHQRIDMWSMKCTDLDSLERLWPVMTMSTKGIWVKPGEVVTGVSVEEVTIPKDHVGIVMGRATYSRLGLSVCSDTAKIQAGRKGHIHFQLINHNRVPIRILPYMRIAQLLLLPITGSYTLDPHQWTGAGVHPPPYQIDLERELAPSVEYAIAKDLERKGTFGDKAKEETERRLKEATSFVEEAAKLGIIPRREKPIKIPRTLTVVLGLLLTGLSAGLIEGLVGKYVTGWPTAHIITVIVIALILIVTIVLARFGSRD